jgi:hypothetical protein
LKTLHALFFLLATATVLISGCTAAMVGGSAARSAGTTFFYLKGEVATDYYQPFDSVWKACKKTVSDMRAQDVVLKNPIGMGAITAVINGKKVKISVTYKAKDLTVVSVRVGLMGDHESSQFIHDMISENLSHGEDLKLYSSNIVTIQQNYITFIEKSIWQDFLTNFLKSPAFSELAYMPYRSSTVCLHVL